MLRVNAVKTLIDLGADLEAEGDWGGNGSFAGR